MEPQRTGAQAIERAIAVLACFVGDDAMLGVSEIARRVELGPSTVHRIVRALCVGGLLAQDTRTDQYHLGPMAAALGLLASERLGLTLAQPELERLAQATGESVNLGVRRGDEVLVILRIPSPHALRFEQAPGSHVPIHTSAMGKALLAFSEHAPVDAVSELSALARLTDKTITRRDALVAELELARARGYAENNEERDVGARAIGVPVLDRSGTARAAISVQAPTARLTDDRVDEIVSLATAAAERLRDAVKVAAF